MLSRRRGAADWASPGGLGRARTGAPASGAAAAAGGAQLPLGSGARGRRRAAGALLRSIAQRVAGKQQSAVEVTKAYLAALRSVEDQVHAFLTVDEGAALAQAAAVDAAIARGEPAGPLAGVPIAIKDNICTAGLRTTAGSRVLEAYAPPFDATAVARLRAAGAVLLGKTNMDEFGMGSSTENSAYQATRNPWDTARVPGGSSGGSAAAVAAGQAAAALGSDTGGSIRQPAHFCGVVGLKPSYGRVSRHGLIAYASSLDCVGPLASSVADAALLLRVMAGADGADATASRESVPDYCAALPPRDALGSAPLAGLRVGVIAETCGEGVSPGVTAAIDGAVAHLQQLGAAVEQVSLPTFALGLPAYYVLALSEASSNLSRYDGVRYGARAAGGAAGAELKAMYGATRGAGLGPEVKRRVLMGTYALSAGYYDAYYKRAQQVRTLVADEMGAALARFDVLLCPAAPTVAYGLGEKAADPLAMYKGDLMTVNLNLSGLPAVVVPCGFAPAEGAPGGALPVGMQLVGRMFGEQQLLRVAHAYEQTAGVARRAPVAAAPASSEGQQLVAARGLRPIWAPSSSMAAASAPPPGLRSGGSSSSAAAAPGGGVLALAWSGYKQQLAKRPLRTKALTSACVASLSDVIAQRLLGGPYNPRRTLKMAVWGLLIGAPSAHYWHAALARATARWPEGSTWSALRRVALDQLTFGPAYNLAFMAYTAMVVNGMAPGAFARKAAAEFPALQAAGWRVWPAVMLVNYRCVPLQLRVLFANVVALFWGVYVIQRSRPKAGPGARAKVA
ncbi:hypothetical protein HT031_001161 [Scenedesmus sp. PABB004]|nr:hypothetical protein HT031_001161 [Scenedesmus sp. PABB004]